MLEKGEIVRFRYDGGSQPGTVREIQVMYVDDTHVQGICYASSQCKTYRIDRMHLVDLDAVITYSAEGPGARFRRIEDAWAVLSPALARPEWHAACDGHSIAVFERFKNGRPRRAPHAIIEIGASSRPFVVRTKLWTRTYASLDRASVAFARYLGLPTPAVSQRVRPGSDPGFSTLSQRSFVAPSFAVPSSKPLEARPFERVHQGSEAGSPSPGPPMLSVMRRLLRRLWPV